MLAAGRVLTLFTLAAASLLASDGDAQVQDNITVARILLDVRVTDAGGDPITRLSRDDFTVKIGGKPAELLSVTWVPETAAARVLDEESDDPEAPSGSPAAVRREPQGRLLVVFIQTDFARVTERVRGQMAFLRYSEELLNGFEPEDRLAVFSFDSHLKFRLDFTSDKTRVAEAIAAALKVDAPPPPPMVPNPSLARRLDAQAMKRAATSETALILVANALRNIEGPKSMLLLGWGLGELYGGQVVMRTNYSIARSALEAARVTIFSLDTTDAAWHSLETGLRRASADTGGFYAKTSEFPKLALQRLHRTLSGHYELEVRRPDSLRPGTHEVQVRVRKRGAIILAPRSFRDSAATPD